MVFPAKVQLLMHLLWEGRVPCVQRAARIVRNCTSDQVLADCNGVASPSRDAKVVCLSSRTKQWLAGELCSPMYGSGCWYSLSLASPFWMSLPICPTSVCTPGTYLMTPLPNKVSFPFHIITWGDAHHVLILLEFFPQHLSLHTPAFHSSMPTLVARK